MASHTPHPQNTSKNLPKTNIPNLPFDPTSSPDTTFVQADPSNFRAVVQKLTGVSTTHDASAGILAGKSFKLHERRHTARKLEIKLNNVASANGYADADASISRSKKGFFEMVMVSPVSPLELIAAGRGSPRTPRSPMEEEERAIAEKGFYLHPIPSPLSATPRGSDPPELLPLFPLHSPRHDSSS